MNIAIDGRWIFREVFGIGNYTRQLIRELALIDRENEYRIIFNDPLVAQRTVDETGIAQAPNFRTVEVGYGIFSPVGQFRLPRLLRTLEIDVYHSTNYMIPLLAFPRRRTGRTACVTTIHDVIPLLYPDHAPRSRKTRLLPVFRRLMREVGMRADMIVTVSETSCRDIARMLCIPEARRGNIRVVYNGVSERYVPHAPAAGPRTGGATDYTVLYVGRSDPYKNLLHLIEAMEAIQVSASRPVRLVIAGQPDPRYPEPAHRARALGIADRVVWAGYLDEDALIRQYQEADVLVHPSRYEGFGLQIVEAMACGTPVVCSAGGSLREVAGDAAVLIDPNDVAGMAEHVVRVLDGPALRAELIEKGLKNARRFTWRSTAEGVLKVYQDAFVQTEAGKA